ncbi:hypothetical protein [Microbacterium sp. MRS-1]|uniref:hypothetical protein n=1 Tax=Microbacterium sp. MRS-1 TaxID=1451261 RepID=UPI00044A6BF8|nr:hypothetical protein [Microbacterium sp. MRS-1]EXJ50771.1 hypothetical protein AS96_13100 [Microbacterium sp. MRS-1]
MSIILFSVAFAVGAYLVLVSGAVVAAHLILWRDRRAVERNAQRDARIATAARAFIPGCDGLDDRAAVRVVLEARP